MFSFYVLFVALIVCGNNLICTAKAIGNSNYPPCQDTIHIELNGRHALKIRVTSANWTPSVYLTSLGNNGTVNESIEYDVKAQEDDGTTFVIQYQNDLNLDIKNNGTRFHFEAAYDDIVAQKTFKVLLYNNTEDIPTDSPDYILVDMKKDNECKTIESTSTTITPVMECGELTKRQNSLQNIES